ncbi:MULTISPECIES: carbamoyltransferase family protein [unclassified Sphingomonas]|uniref:carbamoyltransferase family protein n=1 Tax=unclassified Sphingomonas TaxID=196159 RepID=UPI00082F56DC|nr:MULTISPECIES: carbamoyltransferase [unclassified Sphingomonas]
MKILGISAYYHDAAASLVVDGVVVAAAQEERFTRLRHDPAFPAHAIRACLATAGVSAEDIDLVAFYEKPFLKFDRILETFLAVAPRGAASFRRNIGEWLGNKLFQKQQLAQALGDVLGNAVRWDERLVFSEHHLSHAASAFYPSPFDSAAVLTLDGVGEWTTTSLAVGAGNRLTVLREIHFPHSLGLLYSAFTEYAGFRVNSGEYKLMGLAPYGQPRFADRIRRHLIDIRPDGSFRLDLRYFDYCSGDRMTGRAFHALFGGPPHPLDAPPGQLQMDLAASIQLVLEEVVVALARDIRESTGEPNLCLAGGVALNCVANARLLREGIFDRIWVQPAAGDAGGAVGAALVAHHLHGEGADPAPRRARSRDDAADGMGGALLGPSYAQEAIERRLADVGCVFDVLADDHVLDTTARLLAEGAVVGWHQGRSEFGPRALGARSILADPRPPGMQRHLNAAVKFRESFRPFAPSVLAEHAADWFELDRAMPYMTFTVPVARHRRRQAGTNAPAMPGMDRLAQDRSEINAVTHIDMSARVQTVHRETNPRYHALLEAFHGRTGCPVLANTSFNVRGEPIVETPEDAFHCFMDTAMDALIVGNCVALKAAQTKATGQRRRFTPD